MMTLQQSKQDSLREDLQSLNTSELEPINVLYLVGSPIALAFLVPIELYWNGFDWPIWLFGMVYGYLTSFGISGGYHRLFSHRAYEASAPVRLLYLLLGAASLQNSALKWSYDHRFHHKYVDTDRDPYNINKGFWWAHIGWVFYKSRSMTLDQYPRDLTRDRLVVWQHKFYLPLALFLCFGLPTLFGGLMGNWFGGFVVAGLLRVQITSHLTAFINSACHMFGTQPYSTQTTARDSWWLAILTSGEGYHNFHHHFEFDYRNGVRWYQWDPTKWFVNVMTWFGAAKNLKRATPQAIALSLQKARGERTT